ncbi:MAG TPA: MerR family transcriptional regulator [bacterium]|nr:MerR family transcriptional regulator [bacterium]
MKKLEPDTPVYVISVAADLIGCHPRTLRIYEERGLLSPTRRRRIRLYSARDIQRVRQIRFLTEEKGLNLAGVRMILEIQEHYHEEFTWVYSDGELFAEREDGHEGAPVKPKIDEQGGKTR